MPHLQFDEVFHEPLDNGKLDRSESSFIAGLSELQTRRTDYGAGLIAFLEGNVGQFDKDVAIEIMNLAYQVTREETPEDGRPDD